MIKYKDFLNFVRYCVLKNNGKITTETPIVVVTVVLVVALIAAFFIFSGGESKQLTEPQLATKDSDIVKVEKDTIGISEVKKNEPIVEPMKEEKPKR